MTSTAELTLAAQLEQAGIPFEAEYVFAPEEWCLANGYLTPTGRPKRWRADFGVISPAILDLARALGGGTWTPTILIEIDGGGYIAGRHSRGKGMEADCEKASAAAILGYRVIRVTPRQVEEGLALEWIRAALGLPEKVAA